MAKISEHFDNKILKLIDENPINLICDYGCGTGTLIKRIRESTAKKLIFTGIDCFSKFPVKDHPKNENSLSFIDRDSSEFTNLLNKNSRFDLVISTFALHHYKHPVAELKNMEILLKDNGFLVCGDMSFQNKTNSRIIKNIDSFIGEAFSAFLGEFHRHHYTLEEALDLFKATDLKVYEALNEAVEHDIEEIGKESNGMLKHVDTFIERIPEFKNPILEELFRKLYTYEKELIKNQLIDFSPVFLVTAQKT